MKDVIARSSYDLAAKILESHPNDAIEMMLKYSNGAECDWLEFKAGMTLLPAREMASRVLFAAERYGIEGVTFLGGEPLLQAKGLAVVARAAHRAGLTVMVFTGFTLEECRANPLLGVTELLAETDVLVDGPYLAERPERVRNRIGSANQRFRYFTDAYGPDIETDPAFRGQVEFRIEGDILRMNGCPRTLPSDFNLSCADEIAT